MRMHSLNGFRRLSVLWVFVLLIAACGGTPAAPTTDAPAAGDAAASGGGTLTIGMSAGNIPYPNTPPNEGYEGRRFVGYQIYDGLLNFNLNQGETVPVPVPGLAETWSVANDELTWTFKLREGVKFHDGTDFNAEAAIFQFDRISRKEFEFYDAQISALNSSNMLLVESYRAVDPYTIEIKTKVPYAFLPWDMTHIFFPSPAVVKQHGNEQYVNYASGTGPFRMTRYVDGEVMELEPNTSYWGEKAKLDKIILRPMPDAATRLAALQSGDIDWAEVPPPDSVEQLKAQGYNVLLKQYPHTIMLALNTYDPPFNNPKVRQALQYAIDRDKMCDSLLNKVCAPAYQYLHEGHPWYNAEFGKKYVYDPAKAKQLLAEAGYADGLKITFPYPTSGSGNMWPSPMMELVQANFAEVGVELTIEPLEWNTIISTWRSGFGAAENKKYDGMYISPAQQIPSSLLNFDSSRIPPAGCCDATGYANAQVDDYFRAAQAEFDPAKQDELLRQAMAIVAEESPALFLVHDLNLRALSPSVQGFVQPKSWFADLKTVWIKE